MRILCSSNSVGFVDLNRGGRVHTLTDFDKLSERDQVKTNVGY